MSEPKPPAAKPKRRPRTPKNAFALPVRAADAPPVPDFAPVPRVYNRHDGWTPARQRAFIGALADTGCVSRAARMVNMAQANCYTLRRSPGAEEFRRAWDAALDCGLAQMKDIAFERAIEGVEQEVYDGFGELKGSRTIYNDRLLTFLLGHLRPERYSREARRARAAWAYGGGPDEALAQDRPEPQALPMPAARAVTLDDALRAMEPVLPAPIEELSDPMQLADDLDCAEIADGKLPHFLTEQRAPKSPERLAAEARAAQHERGRLASEKMDRHESVTDAEFEDFCIYIDPTQANEKRRKRKPAKPAREA